jgi:hypothetical protein
MVEQILHDMARADSRWRMMCLRDFDTAERARAN